MAGKKKKQRLVHETSTRVTVGCSWFLLHLRFGSTLLCRCCCCCFTGSHWLPYTWSSLEQRVKFPNISWVAKQKYEGEFEEFLINNREKQHNILCYDEQRAQGQSLLLRSPPTLNNSRGRRKWGETGGVVPRVVFLKKTGVRAPLKARMQERKTLHFRFIVTTCIILNST